MKWNLQKKIGIGLIAVGLTTTLVVKAHTNCDIPGTHIHFYKDPTTDITRLINSEKEKIGDYYKTTDVLPKTDLAEFIAKHKLVNVADCEDAIVDLMLEQAKEIFTKPNEEGIPTTYETTYRYKFKRISYDPQTNSYYLDEQYCLGLDDRAPGFNYLTLEDFIIPTTKEVPSSLPILKN